YGQRSLGSPRTLTAITKDDIHDFAAAHLARDNLVVAAAGDISPEELKVVLDRVFGDLPAKSTLTPVADVVWPGEPASILVPREGTQTVLMFARPGPRRDNPDWYAAEIVNYILGGGGFTSRLMHEVREKNGLTYGIDTGLAPMDHAGMLIGSANADNPKAARAWDLTRRVWRDLYENGVKPEEVKAAKDYLTGSLPLTLTSTHAIAEVLVGIQIERLGRDYLDRRDDYLRAVTDEDIQNVIKKWFDPEAATLVMVGKPENVTPTRTSEQLRE
ncbi:MAG: M16 family metallopeptidase, partial [Bdellovibrionales bacterium]